MLHDLTDPDFLADPAPGLARMRAEGPLIETKVPLIGKIHMTTTDAAARALLKDPRFRRDPLSITGKTMAQRLWFLPPFMKPLMNSMILKDGSEHRRLRTLVELAFARATVDDLVPELERIADGILDNLDPSHPVDLVKAFARPLPMAGISAVLGVPEAERPRIERWMMPLSKPNLASIVLAMPGLWKVMRYFRADIRAGRSAQTGLLQELVAAEVNGARLSEDELLSLIVLLFMAGHETTVHMIADSAWSLIERPELRENLDDPAKLKIMVEELFRFHSPVIATKMMTASEDLEFQGVPVAKGAQVSAFLLAANHDPARWDDPGTPHPGRLPNPHVEFGFGPHVCLGMQLARAEVRVALERLFTRFPNIRLADPSEPPAYGRRFGIRSIPKLMVRLD